MAQDEVRVSINIILPTKHFLVASVKTARVHKLDCVAVVGYGTCFNICGKAWMQYRVLQ